MVVSRYWLKDKQVTLTIRKKKRERGGRGIPRTERRRKTYSQCDQKKY